MIAKLFGKKNIEAKPQDPVVQYVNRICEKVRKYPVMDESIEKAVFTVLDTETTGLDLTKAKIISIAAVKVQNFKIIDFYNTFINPEESIPDESVKWHGVTNDMVKDKPKIFEVLPELIKFIDTSVIVGHHIGFDIKMLDKELNAGFGCRLNNTWLDTMLIYSRAIVKKEDHHTLDHLFEVYKVTCKGRHTALGDALATAEVFNKMVAQASANYKTVKDLAECQKCFSDKS
jgi:DNA polymerase-3 subunit epsilon